MRFCLILSVLGAELYFDQTLDHFSESTTFRQRYVVNDADYREGGPGFLYVGGEGAFNDSLVSTGLVAELAKEHGGAVYGLEHRYYGTSHPFGDLSVANLRFLSSDQALEDLKSFTDGVGRHRRWFLVGSSYSGALAAWARQKYPRVFYGALASSAPIEARADFKEYDIGVGVALGGACSTAVNGVMMHLDDLYAQKQLDPIKRALNCTISDDMLFLSAIAKALTVIVQYNGVLAGPGIRDLCAGLSATDAAQDLLQFQKTLSTLFRNSRKTCYEFSGMDQLLSLATTEGNSMRQFVYQLCQEFGFFQTASAFPMRSKHITLEWFSLLCHPPFFSPAIGPPNTAAINRQHRGQQLNVSNILFTHGELDPWIALSHTQANSIVIPGASHCNDLNPRLANPSLVDARDRIKQTFRSWIDTRSD